MTADASGFFGSKFTIALVGAIGGLILGIFGTVSTGYISSVNTEVVSLNDDIRKFQITSTELLQTLQSYAQRARGGTPLDEGQQLRLRQEITNLYGQAEAISSRDKSVAVAFKSYSNALISLKRSAEMMAGPLDAKNFVECVSDYSVASQDFVSAAVRASAFSRRVI